MAYFSGVGWMQSAAFITGTPGSDRRLRRLSRVALEMVVPVAAKLAD